MALADPECQVHRVQSTLSAKSTSQDLQCLASGEQVETGFDVLLLNIVECAHRHLKYGARACARLANGRGTKKVNHPFGRRMLSHIILFCTLSQRNVGC